MQMALNENTSQIGVTDVFSGSNVMGPHHHEYWIFDETGYGRTSDSICEPSNLNEPTPITQVGGHIKDFLAVVAGREDAGDDVVFFEAGGDAAEELQVGFRIAFVRGEEDGEGNGLFVKRLVVLDGILADCHDHERGGEAVDADMRESESFSDAGGHHAFALPDRIADLVFFHGAAGAGVGDNGVEHFLFRLAFPDQDGVLLEE